MRDFEKIDWEQFNRPPYLQAWLRKDDTFKLFTFGDKRLGEVDDRILALKDLWDLDGVSGKYLDRIGKLLNEKRNGNNDNLYRLLLRLRTLLNTNDGTIPSIIKAIKFLYSSEIVHIVPNYPAGLVIEHDGEGTPGTNFNKILVEIIPAGVGYHTKELFYFRENILSNDNMSAIRISSALCETLNLTDEISVSATVRNNFSDVFNGTLRYNGAIKFDGSHKFDGITTIGDSLVVGKRARHTYNGECRFDGKVKFNSGLFVPI